MQAAHGRYRAALERYRSALAKQESVSPPPPDAELAVMCAMREQSRSIEEYMRVLRIFTDLTLYGKIPEDQS
ncbi:MAG: hypothetical protein C5B51_18680 [Terriglobia bacterium]|nr:MAG: hypothetical protein C5B51_18680 [Terriglobia bacterium]